MRAGCLIDGQLMRENRDELIGECRTFFALPLRQAQADGGMYEKTGMPSFFARLARRQLKSG